MQMLKPSYDAVFQPSSFSVDFIRDALNWLLKKLLAILWNALVNTFYELRIESALARIVDGGYAGLMFIRENIYASF